MKELFLAQTARAPTPYVPPGSAFAETRKVEEEGKQRLAQWLDHVAYEGRWVWNAKGALAELIQRRFDADAMLSTGQFESTSLECKFLRDSPDAPFERWSNYQEMTPGVPDFANCRAGWAMTCEADLVLVYTMSLDRGVVGKLPAWHAMLKERLPNGLRRWHLYQRRAQCRRQQRNQTIVYWTPHIDLVRHANFAEFSARQLLLWEQGNPILRATGPA